MSAPASAEEMGELEETERELLFQKYIDLICTIIIKLFGQSSDQELEITFEIVL